jgi:hypothetical protein
MINLQSVEAVVFRIEGVSPGYIGAAIDLSNGPLCAISCCLPSLSSRAHILYYNTYVAHTVTCMMQAHYWTMQKELILW